MHAYIHTHTPIHAIHTLLFTHTCTSKQSRTLHARNNTHVHHAKNHTCMQTLTNPHAVCLKLFLPSEQKI